MGNVQNGHSRTGPFGVVLLPKKTNIAITGSGALNGQAESSWAMWPGKVKPGSVARDLQKMNLTFTLSGSKTGIPVNYEGTVPDNFTEDREVVVEGRLDTAGVFQADTLMTRCESKYEAKVE